MKLLLTLTAAAILIAPAPQAPEPADYKSTTTYLVLSGQESAAALGSAG